MPNPKSRIEGHSKLKIGRKEALNMAHLEVERLKVKIVRHKSKQH